MTTRTKRSVAPIYLLGATWLCYALLFPLNAPLHYLLCAVLSLVVFVVGKAIFPDKIYQVRGEEPKADAPKEEPKKAASTGDPQIDALVKERERAVSEMRRLNDSIQDERISDQIDALAVMDISPVGYLVTPRLLASLAAFPLLTAIFNVIGIFGGYLSACVLLGLNEGRYFSGIESSVTMSDVSGSFLKAVVFAVIVITVCCFQG